MASAKARAQAAEALEVAARALKRNQGVGRQALQAIRQAQVVLVGVDVDQDVIKPNIAPLEARADPDPAGPDALAGRAE